MSILLSNSILAATEQKLESQLTPENRVNYLKIVTAGMHAALAKGPDGILASLLKSKNPIQDCATGAVNLVGILQKQSRGTMPFMAMVPAAMTLMLKALDFADQNGLVKVGKPELVQATHLFTDLIYQRAGISKGMLATAAARIRGMAQDPNKMEMIKRAAGVVKHPLASTPTPLPPSPPAKKGKR